MRLRKQCFPYNLNSITQLQKKAENHAFFNWKIYVMLFQMRQVIWYEKICIMTNQKTVPSKNVSKIARRSTCNILEDENFADEVQKYLSAYDKSDKGYK